MAPTTERRRIYCYFKKRCQIIEIECALVREQIKPNEMERVVSLCAEYAERAAKTCASSRPVKKNCGKQCEELGDSVRYGERIDRSVCEDIRGDVEDSRRHAQGGGENDRRSE